MSEPEESKELLYKELIKLEEEDLVYTREAFDCEVCFLECAVGEGVVLKDCLHSFCKTCLIDSVRLCQETDIPCPATGCVGMMQEREIRSLVSSEDYDRWLLRGLAEAEIGAKNSFHCRTIDCVGWAFCELNAQSFLCPACERTNCLVCKTIHEGQTCAQHIARLEEAANVANTGNPDESTKRLLDSMITRGEAIKCPECSSIIIKSFGCDNVTCVACKTEICWVTRGRRWGPKGAGDTSAGCRCNVNRLKCHPACKNCH